MSSEPLVSGVDPQTLMRMMGRQGEESTASGTIGLMSQALARYADFWYSLLALVRPASTKFSFQQGMDVAGGWNRIVDQVSGETLWILGDDHTFAPDIYVTLRQVLEENENVDAVVPLVLKKDAPFDPVVYGGAEGIDEATGLTIHSVANLPPTGLHEIFAAGSAGMLIRTSVLSDLEYPVFETTHGFQNEDLNLCKKIRERRERLGLPGTGIYCLVDQKMGHIGIHTAYPMWTGERWSAILDLGNGQLSPFFGITDAELAEMEAEVAALERAE